MVWVSDGCNFILINKIGDIVYFFKDVWWKYFFYGIYIVNSEMELIYILNNFNINKLLKDMEIIIVLLEIIDFKWKFFCVYWLFFIGDLLIGMYEKYKYIYRVVRYN